MTKRTTSPADSWGTTEHETWRKAQFGSSEVLHPVGCRCGECKANMAWARKYQRYIARVDR